MLRKENILIISGVKLIEIPFDKMVASKEELLDLINNTKYPENIYEGLESKSEYKEDRLEKARQFRKDQYKKNKELRKKLGK